MTEPYELTLSQAAKLIHRRELSPVELMASLLARNRALDHLLNVWVTLDEQAMIASARESAEVLTTAGPKGPLHGIPFGVKDIFYTKGVKTTACSKILVDFVPEYDSTAVALLKEAGGIMMGKTVTTEFAMFDPPATKNPWNHTRTPGGSSSGSAVGTAAQMFPAALGSQTAGSVLRPASYVGVCGMKPTLGLISRYGVVPVSHSLDTMGFFTRTVEDAALMLSLLCTNDPQDDISIESEPIQYPEVLKAPLEAPRIAVMKQYFFNESSNEIRAHTDTVITKLADAGAVVQEVSVPSDMNVVKDAHVLVQGAEASTVHQDNYKIRPNDFAPGVRDVIETGLAVSTAEYSKAQELRRIFTQEITAAIKPFDVILTPSTPGPAPDISTTGPPTCQWPWTTCGFPSMTVPSGLSQNGMPLGIQLAAISLNERKLLAVASWCEDVLGVRLTPSV